MSFQPCRRQVLGLGAGVAAAGVLAACSNGTPTPEEGTFLADTSDIPQGQSQPVLMGDVPIMVVHTPEGEFRAFSAVCTHQGCKVVPDEAGPERFECPCHRSLFDAYTGEVLKGPATEDLPEFPITVKDGKILAA